MSNLAKVFELAAEIDLRKAIVFLQIYLVTKFAFVTHIDSFRDTPELNIL